MTARVKQAILASQTTHVDPYVVLDKLYRDVHSLIAANEGVHNDAETSIETIKMMIIQAALDFAEVSL